jgi:methyltransferase-like protein
LQYLGEAHFHEMHGVTPHASTSESAHAHGTIEERQAKRVIAEQYADFLKGRRFRCTLLCRAEANIEIVPRTAAVRGFYVASSLRPTSPESDLTDHSPVEFTGEHGKILEAANPLVKIAFAHLGAHYPQPVSFDELLDATNRRLAESKCEAIDKDAREKNAEMLCLMLLSAYSTSTVELLTHAPKFVIEAGAKPCASRLARFEIERGNNLPNLRHDTVRVEGKLAAHLLSLLDGTRDRAALIGEMRSFISGIAARLDESGAHDEARNARLMLNDLPIALEQNLKHLARLALLVA